MYKELKRWLEDKKILEELIRGLEERIEHKIQKELGIHATTFKELKIQCINFEDKFLNVLAKIENLDNRRILMQEELDVINRELDKIDRLLSNMSDIEKQVFRCRYTSERWQIYASNAGACAGCAAHGSRGHFRACASYR